MASAASREPRRYPNTSGASPRRPAWAGAAGPGSEGGADAVCPSGGPAAPGRSRGGARPRLGAAGAPDPEPDAVAVERDVDGGDRDLGGLGGAKMGGPDHPPQKGPRPRPRRPHGMATSAAHRGGKRGPQEASGRKQRQRHDSLHDGSCRSGRPPGAHRWSGSRVGAPIDSRYNPRPGGRGPTQPGAPRSIVGGCVPPDTRRANGRPSRMSRKGRPARNAPEGSAARPGDLAPATPGVDGE